MKKEKTIVLDGKAYEISDEKVTLNVVTDPELLRMERVEVIGDTHGLMNIPSRRDLVSVKVEEGVLQVGTLSSFIIGSFEGFEDLKEVFLPDSLRIIEFKAFENCHKLELVDMSKNLLYIGFHAFGNCRGLKTIDLYPGLEVIEEFAFAGCTSLKEVRYHSEAKWFKQIKVSPHAFEKGVTIICENNEKIVL